MEYKGFQVKISKGIYYFPTYQLAREYMQEHNTGLRIVEYGLGYAIQLKISGPYIGTASSEVAA